ncbi:hypothetical protein EVG20_g11084 [Dentipellis fragilis]|uniref:Uncharacterized protein n=1 Tax=Dentipellis fragilis TaxID=205917 RepID=A0A4Y9XPH4_9AGAM|nr:hypothetical protein EVG20_g11084 [Dentipellis fragilis]
MALPLPSASDPVPPNAISAIRFLTSFLHGLEPLETLPNGTVRPVQPLKAPRPSKAIIPYAHLATMLNLGDPHAMVVAVTGCLHPDQGPNAAIVISSNSGGRSTVDPSSGEMSFNLITLLSADIVPHNRQQASFFDTSDYP